LCFISDSSKASKSVRFAKDKENDEVHIERRRDLSIYTGYCAIKNVMYAVYFCAECIHEKLVHPVQESNSLSPLEHMISSMSSNESGMSDSGYNFQEDYSKNVTQKLQNAKRYLSKLQPLAFRMEILENIFSLLFLSHEEIQETSAIFDPDSETEDEEERGRSETVVSPQNLSVLSEGSTSSLSQTVDDRAQSEDMPEDVSGSFTGGYDEPFVENVLEVKSQKMDRSASHDKSRSTYLERLNSLKEKLNQQKGGSENGSTISSGSTSSCRKFGFLCNEYLVRDILLLLKECLVDLSSARFQMMGKEKETSGKPVTTVIDTSLEEPLSRLVQSSVEKDSLQKHLSQLQQFVSEALWRFQLVCHEMIPPTPGEVLAKPLPFSLEENDEEMAFSLQKNGLHKRARRISSSSKGTQILVGKFEKQCNDFVQLREPSESACL
jgi:zinc finger FYVE domain-containing protein 26